MFDLTSQLGGSSVQVGECVYLPAPREGLFTLDGMKFLQSGMLLVGQEATYPEAHAMFTNLLSPAGSVGFRSLNNPAMAYSSGLYVAALTDGFYRSTDMLTWTKCTMPQVNTGVAITYYAGVFIAFGYYTGGTAHVIYTSPDGITWTLRTNPASTASSSPVLDWASSGSILVACGANSKLMTSPDGLTWTARTSPNGTSSTHTNVVYGAGLFGLVKTNAKLQNIYTSTDGIAWSVRSNVHLRTDVTFTNLHFLNGQFILEGTSDALGPMLWTSPDGIAWTLMPAAVLGRKIYFDGKYYSVKNDYVGISNDLVNWNQLANTWFSSSTINYFDVFNGVPWLSLGGTQTYYGVLYGLNKTIGLIKRTVDSDGSVLCMRVL